MKFVKYLIIIGLMINTSFAQAMALIDSDVTTMVTQHMIKAARGIPVKNIGTIVFVDTPEDANLLADDLKKIEALQIKKYANLPLILVMLPPSMTALNAVAEHPIARQITHFKGGKEELELSEKAILLRPSNQYPDVSNWWNNGYSGMNSKVGLLDSGVAVEHPSLEQKQFITRQEAGSGYNDFHNGVRTAHGTGVACIYAGSGSPDYPNDIGIAHNASIIVSALAGEGDGNFSDLSQTLSSLDWMLNRSSNRPDVINYSFGNGLSNCAECSDWSGLAKVVDYVINHEQILWVKSSGNGGYVVPSGSVPYASTMTTPADSYNGITVANMNTMNTEHSVHTFIPDRAKHTIHYNSSRGPTKIGRKKPDITAPGNDTRTCAPDPEVYSFTYTPAMDYLNGYRLMGGTSSAAPHVGAAILLLRNAGIISPVAIKALLINSADAYTDGNMPGPNDPKYPYKGGHGPVMGSEWNRTYGFGYLNMQKAFEQREFITENMLSLDKPERVYEALLPVGAKVTLVHERRVGYTDSREWKLSHISLEIVDVENNQIIAFDDSAIDTVHQVANCQRSANQTTCSATTKPLHALIKVKLKSTTLDGAIVEPFALAVSVAFKERT